MFNDIDDEFFNPGRYFLNITLIRIREDGDYSQVNMIFSEIFDITLDEETLGSSVVMNLLEEKYRDSTDTIYIPHDYYFIPEGDIDNTISQVKRAFMVSENTSKYLN